ncbi:lytic transglycosylase domain-containing protein [Glaciihabitans sp. dw_435]|uniref:aggregation-promoting factor C-terminal-like domain-containing protein n=1 Tax=Glaciihabitans sp. dw_435 TaxID=2720081 RepID=UPI001BD327DB|nr:lytic transglycosylase domain-containing protein [Glaciihabitans sp. dw_435]
MGRHLIVAASRPPVRRPQRSPRRLPAIVVASAATMGLVLVLVVDPYSGVYANAAEVPDAPVTVESQALRVSGDYDTEVARDDYKVVLPPEPSTAVSGTPDPGSAKAIAKVMLKSRGWGSTQYNCLVSLWNRESGWNVYAANPNGAYGIPQAYPGSKMASAGSNWQTSAVTQITWGIGYIQGRYGTPCGAWAHSQAVGSY